MPARESLEYIKGTPFGVRFGVRPQYQSVFISENLLLAYRSSAKTSGLFSAIRKSDFAEP